jgi:hypothetical protein
VQNTGLITLTMHDLVDSELGVLLSGFSFDLVPGATTFITETANITVTTVNSATWTAGDGIETVFDSDFATVNVEPPMPVIQVSPSALASTQAADAQLTRPMTITNIGTGSLDWNIFEDNTTQIVPQAPKSELAVEAPSNGATPDVSELLNPQAVLYDQTDNPGTNGAPSQYFPDLVGFGHAAEDFVIPVPGWTITRVVAIGSYTAGDGPAPDFDVNIYADSSGSPGTLVYTATAVVASSDVGGVVTVDLTSPASLGSGNYWVSVVANMAFNPGTQQWFWSTRAVQSGQPYHWTETGLFASPCIGVWQPGGAVCGVGGGVDPDLLFALEGSIGGGGPLACDAPEDIPWASVSPASGTTGSGSSSTVDVTFDSTGIPSGIHTGALCVDSNAVNEPIVTVPVTLTVVATPTYGVDLSASQVLTGLVGTTVTYTLQITNTGDVADVYTITTSGHAWPTTLSQGSIVLDPGATAMMMAFVDVPAGASNNDMDTATVLATSQGDPVVSDTMTLMTIAVRDEILVYLPTIPKLFIP